MDLKGLAMSLKGWLSTIGLVGLIVFDLILIVICFLCHQGWWGFFFIGITALVGIFEILSYIITGKTISQHWWAWETENTTMKWAALGALVAFLLAINSLAIHLLSPLLAQWF